MKAGIGRVKVLESVAPPGETVKYIDQVVRLAPNTVEFSFFSWSSAIFGRYDVFHVHWPEFLLRGSRWWISLSKSLLFLMFLARLRLARPRIVRTIHNLHPHSDGGRLEAWALREFDKLVTDYVRLNETTPLPERGRSFTVLHGHYRDVFSQYKFSNSVAGRLSFVGRIEPYKGVENLLTAFRALRGDELSLRIVGKVGSDLGRRIRSSAAQDSRVSVQLDFVSDSNLVREITESQLVVLPYEEMHNSGMALVALSLARPVLVPRTPANETLAQEMGEAWVLLYDGQISAEVLMRSMFEVERSGRVAVNLDRREWDKIALQYAKIFEGVHD